MCGLFTSVQRRARMWVGITTLIAVSVSYSAAAIAADVVPDWLRAQTSVPLPAYDEKTNAIVLYDEQITTVAPTGKIRYLQRKAIRIMRPDGESWGVVKVNFDDQTRITKLRAWSIPAEGKPFEVKQKQAMETALFGVENGELISDVRTRLLNIPAATPGSVIGYEWEQEENPLLPLIEWDFQDTVPVRLAKYTLILPPGWRFLTSWLNHAQVESTSPVPGQWQWSVGDLAAIRTERAMPPWRKIAGRMSLQLINPNQTNSAATSWGSLGAWYAGLAKGRQELTPDMRRKVAELSSTAGSLLEKMNALAAFVQNDIRYVAIELGIGGHQPHTAAETFKNRYGDCKDKATLLASLLRELGVESYYVAINTERGAVNLDTAPSLSFTI